MHSMSSNYSSFKRNCLQTIYQRFPHTSHTCQMMIKAIITFNRHHRCWRYQWNLWYWSDFQLSLSWISIVTQEKIVCNTQYHCEKTISNILSNVIMLYDFWQTWKSTADQNTLFPQCASLYHHWRAGVTLMLSPSNYKSSQACGCRPERQREPKSFRQHIFFFWPTVWL